MNGAYIDRLTPYEIVLLRTMIEDFPDLNYIGVGRGQEKSLPHNLHDYRPFSNDRYLNLIKRVRDQDPTRFDKIFKDKRIAQKAATKERARLKQKKKTEEKKAITFSYTEQKDIVRVTWRVVARQLEKQLRELSQQCEAAQYLGFSIRTSWKRSPHVPEILNNIQNIMAKNIDKSGNELHEAIKTLPYYEEVMNELLNKSIEDYRRFAIHFMEGGGGLGMLDKSEKIRLASKLLEKQDD